MMEHFCALNISMKYIYIYIYIYVCVCVCVGREREREKEVYMVYMDHMINIPANMHDSL